MIGYRFGCLTETNSRRSVMLFAACLCLAVLMLGQATVFACVEEPLYADIQHSFTGEPGSWVDGSFSVGAGAEVYFRAADNSGDLASTEDLDDACGSQQTDTALYNWDFNYDTGTDDTGVDPSPVPFSAGGTCTVRLYVDDMAGDCKTDDDPEYDYITVTVVGSKLYVNENDGNDYDSGASWSDAKATIGGALAIAVPGQEIWVAAGTYEETFSLLDAVKVYGGFDGTEDYLSERDPRANETIIEGYVGSPSGRGSATLIDGFTIDGEGNEGWGVIIYNSSPVVTNNVIHNQVANGIRCYGDSSPTITDNLILNSQGVGAGINVQCNANVVNNTICGFSKGISCMYSGSPNIHNNIVAFNDINMYGDGVSTPTFSHNCVYGATTANYSGVSAGTGDISLGPSFVDKTGGNYHLSVCSPCIDAGSDVPGVPNVDFDGEQRTFGTYVDIGMDEAQFSRDTTGPSLAIVSPMGTTWHVAPSQSIVIKWTATDAESGIDTNTVQIDTGSGWSSSVTYDSGSDTWSYTWPSPSSTTISIQATNNCGNTTTMSAGITVTTASVIFVDPDGQTQTGHDWDHAYHTVTNALNNATSGDEIWVAADTYYENIGLVNGVEIYGGFAGTETVREHRNWLANETILDGSGSGSVVTAGSGVTSSARIDGFTIQHGSQMGSAGGGIYCDGASPVIANNLITANVAEWGGAALFCTSNGNPLIANNCIVGNTTDYGAAIESYYNGSTTISITNNTIVGNSAGGTEGTMAVSNNIIAFNTGCGVGSGATVRNNCVYGNSTDYDSWVDTEGSEDISVDPRLVNYYGDLHLRADSPCIDAGWNQAAGLPVLDFDGESRMQPLGSQSPTVDIGADESPNRGLVIEVTASDERIPPDGTSTTTITATAHDTHEQPLVGETVHLTTDFGVFLPEIAQAVDRVVDSNGEVTATLRSGNVQETATVAAGCGTFTSTCFVEFANADPPSIHIVQPLSGETVAGSVNIYTVCEDFAGSNQGVAMVSLFIDDVELTTAPAALPVAEWDSSTVANGTHELYAIAYDNDGNSMRSNIVAISTQNEIFSFSVSPQQVVANQAVSVSAQLAAADNWQIVVRNVDGSPVWSTFGTGTSFTTSWPGISAAGIYSVSVSKTTSEAVASAPVVCNTVEHPQLAIIITENVWASWKTTAAAIQKYAQREGISYGILLPDGASWNAVKNMIGNDSNPGLRYLYINCHGHWDTGLAQVTHLMLAKDKVVLYAHPDTYLPPPNPSDPPSDTHYTGWKVRYANELGRYDQCLAGLRFAWLDACFSGHIGAERPMPPDPDAGDYLYGQYGIYSCYNTTSWNDMAIALGINAEATYTHGCAYIGYYDKGWAADARYCGSSAMKGLIPQAWDQLLDGFTFDFVRTWIEDYHPYTQFEDELVQCIGDHIRVAPFYNWRFWGTPLNSIR